MKKSFSRLVLEHKAALIAYRNCKTPRKYLRSMAALDRLYDYKDADIHEMVLKLREEDQEHMRIYGAYYEV